YVLRRIRISSKDPMTKNLFVPILLVTLSLALLWQAPSISRILRTPQNFLTGNELRFTFWKTATDLFLRSPIFGVGFGAFSKISPLISGGNMFLHAEHAENEYLEMLCTGGLVAFIPFFFLLMIFIRRTI